MKKTLKEGYEIYTNLFQRHVLTRLPDFHIIDSSTDKAKMEELKKDIERRKKHEPQTSNNN